jgi:Domain of unknown function (DUF1707)/Cell wall-active antibiotics response 4TMS YvqF
VEGSRHVSDLEREETVRSLRDELAAGRLTLEEFSERVDVAYGARTAAELVRAREHLPAPPAAGRRRPPARLSGAVLGRAIRRGRMLIRRRTAVVGVAADVDLDLREAEIQGDRVTVSVLVAFGNVDVYVPEGIDVMVSGLIPFGRHRHWGRDTATPGAPTVRVRVFGCFGTVDVWRVPRDVQGDYGEIQEQLEERQRRLAP